jgi:hypothetical protein
LGMFFILPPDSSCCASVTLFSQEINHIASCMLFLGFVFVQELHSATSSCH